MIDNNIPEMKLKKIVANLIETSEWLIKDLNSMQKGSIDYLQMQTFIMGFHRCLEIVKGIIHD